MASQFTMAAFPATDSRSIKAQRAPIPTKNSNSPVRRKEPFNAFLRVCRERDLKVEQWGGHFCQGSYTQLQTNGRAKWRKYADPWNAGKRGDDDVEALNL